MVWKLVHECNLFTFFIRHSCFVFKYQSQASLYLSSNGQEVLNVKLFCSQVSKFIFHWFFLIHAKYSSNTDALTFHRAEAIDKSCEYYFFDWSWEIWILRMISLNTNQNLLSVMLGCFCVQPCIKNNLNLGIED